MDIQLTDDQVFFRDTTRKFLESECPVTKVRSLESEPAGYETEYWRRGAELGWTSPMISEPDGGGSVSGDGVLDLVLIAEEMGRLVSPGPLLPTNVVASAIAASGSPDQREALLPGIIAGDVVAAWCHTPPGSRRSSLEAVIERDGVVLSGVACPVEAAGQAECLLVTARTGAGLTQCVVGPDWPGITITPMESIDLVKRVAEVRFSGVHVPLSAILGQTGDAALEAERQLNLAVALQCAESVGAVARVFEFTLEYAADRYSFGRPLASYQALKHRFADMKMWLEACAAIADAAARSCQQHDPDAAEIASAAKVYIGPRATEIVQDCIQMHGGIGVTWEHDLHLYLRRVTFNRAMYGPPDAHAERVATMMGLMGSGIKGTTGHPSALESRTRTAVGG